MSHFDRYIAHTILDFILFVAQVIKFQFGFLWVLVSFFLFMAQRLSLHSEH